MNGLSVCDLDDSTDIDIQSITEWVLPKLIEKQVTTVHTTPDGRQILHNVKPQVEITRKFCPDVRRTSSYPDITKHSDQATDTELKLQKQRIVNTELKRLLIASVGDTLANRLEKLANEKAQLHGQVNILAKQTAGDAEKIESLAIQGDIWKSKFLAARVVVNELSVWKDSVTDQLHQTQQALQNFEEHKKHVCHALHMADKALADTIVDMRTEVDDNAVLPAKLKAASICISELLDTHTKEMCSFSQNWERLPPQPRTPNLNTNNSFYNTYQDIVLRSPNCNYENRSDCCTHDSPHEPILQLRTTPKKPTPPQSYDACKRTLLVGGCKCCAQRQILHL